MAVSYLSQTLKADPYVIPLDLNLMGKVLSVKQQKFDLEGQKIQQGINQLGSADIMKQQDKEYLNSKLNKLVDSLNSFGGVDLADQNISSQIESMGGDIYNDKNVINAISSTKSIRALQAGYQEYKTNPKLSKLYSSANEYNDNLSVQSYLADENVGSSYGGASAPTPYVPYKENLIKNIQGVKANLTQTYTANGDLIYLDKEHKEIKPEQIVQMAKDLSTADEVGQMGRDGVYQFKNLSPQDLLQKSIELNNQKISSAAATLDRYNSLYLQATNDPYAKEKYSNLIKMQTDEIKALQNVKGEDLVNKYKQNPTEFTKSVYMDEFYRGLGQRFAYSEDRTKVVPNTAAIANLKLEQSERFHNDQMNYLYYKENIKLDKDGNLTKNPTTTFTTEPPNTQDPDSMLSGEAAIDAKNKEYIDTNTNLVTNLISSLANRDPAIRNVLQSQMSPSGQVTTLAGQNVIENNNNTPGLQLEDLNLPAGSAQYKKAVAGGITPAQLKIYNDLYLTYEQQATGIDKGIKTIPPEMIALVEQKQLNDAAIEANNTKKQAVTNALSRQYGISNSDLVFYNKYKALKSRNKITSVDDLSFSPITKSNLTPQDFEFLKQNREYFNRLDEKIDSSKYEEDKKKYYDQVENRVQWKQAIIGNGFVGNKAAADASKLFVDILNSRGDLTQSVKVGEVTALSDNVEIVRAGKSADGSGQYELTGKVKSPDGKEVNQYTVRLSPDNVKEFGFQQNPYDAVDDEVNIQGYSKPKLISATPNKSIPNRSGLKAKVVVYRLYPNSNNDFTSAAYIEDDKGNKIADIPGTKRESPSVTYVASKQALQLFENKGMTRDQMLEYIKTNSNNQ